MTTVIDIDNIDFLFKIIVIGESNVGKTNVISRYNENIFDNNTKNTIGVDFFHHLLKVDNYNIKIQLWDTAGQERYKSMNHTYYKSINGAILVYDITNKDSFEKLDNWYEELNNNCNNMNLKTLLWGNKSDLEDKRVINYNDGMDIAKGYDSIFYETSAKTNNENNINKSIHKLVSEIVKYESKFKLKKTENISYKIQNEEVKIHIKKDKTKCC